MQGLNVQLYGNWEILGTARSRKIHPDSMTFGAADVTIDLH
jgi:hypothetical protein